VLADPRQVEHERLLILGLHLGLQAVHQRVLVHPLRRAGEVVIPVGAPLDLLHGASGQLGLRPGDRVVLGQRRGDQLLVVIAPRLVVVIDRGQIRVVKDGQKLLDPPAGLQPQPALAVEFPAAAPVLVVLPALGVAQPGLGLDIVEPHVLRPRPVGPHLLAGHAAGVAADALVQVHHHADLRLDPHSNTTSDCRLRSTVTSSR